MKIETPKQVLSFWKKAGPKRWFKSDPEFDHTILDKFLVTHQAAGLGKLASWEDEAESALALVIVLDQFPRNMFRGTARAFSTDALALAAAKRAIEHGFDRKIKIARTVVSLSSLRAQRKSCRSGNLAQALRGNEGQGIGPLGEAPSRHHPALRTLSAPERNPRAGVDAGGNRLSRRGRLSGVTFG